MDAAAQVHACIYVPTPLTEEVIFNFTPTNVQCMSAFGEDASLIIPAGHQGLFSACLGYVESKTTGIECNGQPSKWNLGYTTKSNSYTGSVKSTWHCNTNGTSSIVLVDPGTTTVNTSPSMSYNTSQEWSKIADLYIIFKPY